MIHYGLIGAGGHGRETMPVAAEMLRRTALAMDYSLMFVVEGSDLPAAVNGYPLVSLATYLALEGNCQFNVAIADAKARERIANTCLEAGLKPFDIISQSTLVMDNSKIGEGVMLSPFSVVTSNTRIGRFFHANIYARVAHDCTIGDFVTFGPGAQCNGWVTVEDYALIGGGAQLAGTRARPLTIGRGAVVGMGAVVTRDVAPFTTVVGNPARPITR